MTTETTTFIFTGDHTAVEEWAATCVSEHTGRTPEMAVFSGDYQGIYIDPQRLGQLGINARYADPVLVRRGETVEWTGTEFSSPMADDVAAGRNEWRTRAQSAEAAVEQVRALHPRVETISHVICGTCIEPDRGHQLYPCATLRALDGEA